MSKSGVQRRPRGQIRPRGDAFQVVLFAGRDPLTGPKLYLCETVSTEPAARRMLTKLISQVDEQKHPTTLATFRVVMDKSRHRDRVHLAPAQLIRCGARMGGRVTCA